MRELNPSEIINEWTKELEKMIYDESCISFTYVPYLGNYNEYNIKQIILGQYLDEII